MRLKGNVLPAQFTGKAVRTLWESRIKDLTAFKKYYSESILVALDVEMSSENRVSEVGIAIPLLKGQITQLYEGIKQLHHKGGASAFTIHLRERKTVPKEKMLGQVIRSHPCDVTSVIGNILAEYEGRLVLVGFDLYHEFKWIMDDCPTIFSCFAAWLDVQEFAMQRRDKLFGKSESAHLQAPGLSDVLLATDIRHWERAHYAVNDALRSLIVLCGLASDPFLLSDMRSRLASRDSVRCYAKLRFVTGATQIARVSATINGEKLPPWSPNAVARYFAAHTDLKAVGLNWKKEKDRVEGVRFWQLTFSTVESLERFISGANGSTLETTKLRVFKYNSQNNSAERMKLTD